MIESGCLLEKGGKWFLVSSVRCSYHDGVVALNSTSVQYLNLNI